MAYHPRLVGRMGPAPGCDYSVKPTSYAQHTAARGSNAVAERRDRDAVIDVTGSKITVAPEVDHSAPKNIEEQS